MADSKSIAAPTAALNPTAEAVNPLELELLSLSVAQARSAIVLIAESIQDHANAHMALFLVVESLQNTAAKLDEMHFRHRKTVAADEEAQWLDAQLQSEITVDRLLTGLQTVGLTARMDEGSQRVVIEEGEPS